MLNHKSIRYWLTLALVLGIASCGGSQSDGFLRFLSFSVTPSSVAEPSTSPSTISLSYSVDSSPTAHGVNWWIVPLGTTDDAVAQTSAVYSVQCPDNNCVNKAIQSVTCNVTKPNDDANSRIVNCGVPGIPAQKIAKGKYKWVARAANYRANFGIVPDTDSRTGEIEFR